MILLKHNTDKFDTQWKPIYQFFADNAAFIGSLSQILQVADIMMYYARIWGIDLQLNSPESIIYIKIIGLPIGKLQYGFVLYKLHIIV